MFLLGALLLPAAVVVTNDGAPEVADQVARALLQRGLEVRVDAAPLSEDCARNPHCADRPRADRIVWIGRGEIEVIGVDGTVVDSALVADLDTALDRVAAASRIGVGVPPPLPGDDAHPPAAPVAPSTSPSTTAPAISDDTTTWIIAGALGAVVAVAAVLAMAAFATESPAQQQQDATTCATGCAGDLLDNCLNAAVDGCFDVACSTLCSGVSLQAIAAARAPRAPAAPVVPPRSSTAPSMRY